MIIAENASDHPYSDHGFTQLDHQISHALSKVYMCTCCATTIRSKM